MIIMVCGPDGCGKTEISKELSSRLVIPYFKVDSEKKNWNEDSFKNSLWFDRVLPQFIKATNVSCIFDRGFPSEFCYPRVFGRKTDMSMLAEIDDSFAKLQTIVIVALRRDYSTNRDDELVPNDKLTELHNSYIDFCNWTRCSIVKIYVDDYSNDLKKETDILIPILTELKTSRHYATLDDGLKLIKRVIEL